MIEKKDNPVFLIDRIIISGNIDDMEIITPTHFDFAMVALGIKSKSELARKISVGASTLDALYGVIKRNVSQSKRIAVRMSLDKLLISEGWTFLKGGGIAKIPLQTTEDGGLAPISKPSE